ncbi:hypothetical protein DFH28DRAFT_881593 [Melampsora americana]|nr:hypothetical protein DFH28DRAFT_912424 [Melampsora americana]KAH9815466.1 hypothetical protein DFH28DRAFT_892947 [Melampsora americana]KAH9817936.1 hypothetical protein DFH28DRAFT_889134 [Melampsora americana]KAH9822494.1 hypothetical protein DFH28DRAFT_881593 [Melampsora americana]
MPTRASSKRQHSPSPKQPTPTPQRKSRRLQPNTTATSSSHNLDTDDDKESDFADEEEQEDTESESDTPEDKPAPKVKTHRTTKNQLPLPLSPSSASKPTNLCNTNPHHITLKNYNECDLDESAIDELLANKDRKTSNRVPTDVQQELKNLQAMYRRSKKLLSLVSHCSERTVNEFLYVKTLTTSLDSVFTF